jgi:hypothetical protein
VIFAIAVFFALGSWQPASESSQPRISATDTAYLGCSAWTGKNWTPLTSRIARTQITESSKGFRAYAEVKAIVHDDSCENTTIVYVTSADGKTFRPVYTVAPSKSEGNGIRLIGWSPSGDQLLAEINLWQYETDRGFGHIALLYDAAVGRAKEIEPDKAVSRHFGSNCEYELSIESWRTDEQMIIKVSKSPEDESYEQRFCVNAPQKFLFDIQKQTLRAETEGRRKTN